MMQPEEARLVRDAKGFIERFLIPRSHALRDSFASACLMTGIEDRERFEMACRGSEYTALIEHLQNWLKEADTVLGKAP